MNPAGDSPMRRGSVKMYEVPVKFGLERPLKRTSERPYS